VHGGSVNASSEAEGKGAAFVVRLPIADINAQARAARAMAC
jgi:signal transduction histidine kinase